MPENKTWYGWIPMPVRVVGIALGLYGGYRLISREVDRVRTEKRKRQLENTQVNYVYTDASGQSQVSTVDVGTVAAGIYDSFYNNDWFGYTEDEERAMRLLLGVPRESIPALEDIYFQLYQKILREDFIDYLSSEEWDRVKHMFS